ncbi:BsuPI-related putative proteinase inhibitor [uncultured Ferrimonas sp.]|uniref:BsuPI-related putative proteinase inhibitor n=1 Tax=uncultured Ferrimonas sp. TaxID=432640 RepID=UPI00260F3C3B|nr:BsuPI-related putative proteinase inhibitor [uncultured Ferrimonas sp.]
MNKLWMLLPLLAGCAQATAPVAEQPVQPEVATKAELIADAQPDPSVVKIVQDKAISPLTGQINTESRWDRMQGAKAALHLHNTSKRELRYTIRSGMMADFSLSQNGQVVWRYSQDMMFTQALSEMRLPALGERKVTIHVSPRSLTKLAPGSYYLHAELNLMDKNAGPTVKPVLVELF